LNILGFFRVNYDEENWNALISQLHDDCNEIHVLNRAQLIDDAFNLAIANRMDYSQVLKLSEYLINENDPVPWYSAQNGFTYLMNRMRRCPNGYKKLKVNVTIFYYRSRRHYWLDMTLIFYCFLIYSFSACYLSEFRRV